MKHCSRISAFARIVLLPFAICSFCSGALAQNVPPYRDPKLPIEQRIADLFSRMTLDEKLAKMEGAWENRSFMSQQEAFFVDQKGAFLPEKAAVVLKLGLGEISRPSEQRGPRAMAEFTNTVTVMPCATPPPTMVTTPTCVPAINCAGFTRSF